MILIQTPFASFASFAPLRFTPSASLRALCLCVRPPSPAPPPAGEGRVKTAQQIIQHISASLCGAGQPSGSTASLRSRTAVRRYVRHTLSAITTTPAPTIAIPIHSCNEGRSARNRKAKSATNTTLSLSIGATLAASPSWRARK